MPGPYHKQDFLLHKENDTYIENFIHDVFSKCLGIAHRYCRTESQKNELSKKCFLYTLKFFIEKDEEEFNDITFLKQYKICLAKNILSARKGELIADTVYVTNTRTEENLFSTSEYYKNLSAEDIITHLRKLNPLQQIIYNLIYIDNFTIPEVADIIQYNELSVKALSEKAKHNLFASIKSII